MEAIGRHKEFLFEYRQALQCWKEEDRDVIFPAGTYAMRIYAGVNAILDGTYIRINHWKTQLIHCHSQIAQQLTGVGIL